ncbi:MAG: ATPase, T2SS/T4P/T4SS family [Comamonas sp.]|jgi:general secretion pathway protein E|uniref:GspE/PulE family protein n=1 Tax=Comamonas sp. TaxID=34028 RepID=UPI002FC758E2
MSNASNTLETPELASTRGQGSRQRLGELLQAAGKLNERDLQNALQAQQELGGYIGQVLIRLGVVAEADVMQALAKQLEIPLLSAEDFPDTFLDVPGLYLHFLEAQCVCPIALRDTVLQVAMAAPQDGYVCKALQLATGLKIEPLLALEGDIRKALVQLEEEPESDADAEWDSGSGDFVEHLKDLASEAPVIRLVSNIIARAIELQASDIHLEPFESGLQVRYRMDGVIHAGEMLSSRLSAAVGSRVKLLAHLDIAERRLPQDGRIKTRAKGRELDLRVSTTPTVHGESIVMRVLDRASVRLSLESMGFSADTLKQFNHLLTKPHGIVLVTGPTGSGKTTTLYAALSKIDAIANKIITVEDPVEYQLEGVNQIQVHPQINLTFANALRSILRQDPDIIMIGEMRDTETAQIAVQSALTGHLVLSTLHTNTAAGAVTRMRDMGVESYLITSSINGVLAQRLVRTLCKQCKQPDDLPSSTWTSTGLERFANPGQTIYRAVGCEHCRGTGYKGRTAIHELLILDERLRQAILNGEDANALHARSTQHGMISLYEDGLRKVVAGLTTLDEVLRVTQDQGDA